VFYYFILLFILFTYLFCYYLSLVILLLFVSPLQSHGQPLNRKVVSLLCSECSVMTMVYLRQYCGLLPLWQPRKKTSFKVHDTLQPCCLLRANLAASLSVRLQWSSNETQENIRNSDVPSHRFSLWPRVLELFCVSVCHHF